ncbi:MAG TPA: FHA domain-containing protein, partial [Lacipirellulaceae bacterium]|nr:FHA domain-containing protein [Lacipirellulaceae bacterium]
MEDAVHSVGRTHTHSIRLHDTEVSRNHAEFIRRGDTYLVRDLGSSNGTFVNGALVNERSLVTGDQVQVGRSMLLFTGFNEERLEDLAGKVDIVPRNVVDDGSRIVASLSQTGGSEWLMPDARGSSNPWLSRARSNLQIMYRTALAVSHTMDIDQLLARIMDLIFDWVEAERGCIRLEGLETRRPTP